MYFAEDVTKKLLNMFMSSLLVLFILNIIQRRNVSPATVYLLIGMFLRENIENKIQSFKYINMKYLQNNNI